MYPLEKWVNNLLLHNQVKQVWFADDAIAGAWLYHLRAWWDHLVDIGPEYGYHPNASKTWLTVKAWCCNCHIPRNRRQHHSRREEATWNRSRHEIICRRVCPAKSRKMGWWDRTPIIYRPHATSYSLRSLTHGLMSKWMFLARTVADIGDLFKPLEDAIRHRFLPALTGLNTFNGAERELMALPVRMGGLGITNPTTQTAYQYSTSMMVTAPLTALILQESPTCSTDVKSLQQKAKTEARKTCWQLETHAASELADKLPYAMQRSLKAASEKGSSSWLSTLPIAEHGFALHKGAFRDALCLTGMMEPVLTLSLRAFGDATENAHFSMSGSSTLLRWVTATPH